MSRWRPRVAFPESAPQVLSAHDDESDSIPSQIVKFIPGETITAYQGVAGLVTLAEASEQVMLLTWAAIAGLFFTFFWNLVGAQDSAKNEPLAWSQAIVSTIAFVVWLFAINSPVAHKYVGTWNELRGSVLLLLATVLILPVLGRILNRFFRD